MNAAWIGMGICSEMVGLIKYFSSCFKQSIMHKNGEVNSHFSSFKINSGRDCCQSACGRFDCGGLGGAAAAEGALDPGGGGGGTETDV